jgi:hypothetical protein
MSPLASPFARITRGGEAGAKGGAIAALISEERLTVGLEIAQSTSMFESQRSPGVLAKPRGGRNGRQTARRASPSEKHPNHHHEKPRPARSKYSDRATVADTSI